jgi:hypothetical protein
MKGVMTVMIIITDIKDITVKEYYGDCLICSEPLKLGKNNELVCTNPICKSKIQLKYIKF